MRVDLDRTGGTLDSFIRIFDSAFALQNANNDGAAPGEAAGTTDSFLEHAFTAAGVYYVVVNAAGNNKDARTLAGRVAASTGGYTLAVSNATPRVVGRQVFYNNSAFDGSDAAAGPADDAAIATDKAALFAGQPPTFANLTTYDKGLNGIMIDVEDLRRPLTSADFSFKVQSVVDPVVWVDAPAPSALTVRALGGPGPHRVTITWPDRAIRNRWLQVAVLSTDNTGLLAPDVFYFGNLAGKTPAGPLIVTAADVVRTRAATSAQPVALDHPNDHNRDGYVNIRDQIISRTALGNTLRAPTFPVPAAASSIFRATRVAPLTRTAWLAGVLST